MNLKALILGLSLLSPLAVSAETGSALKNDTLRRLPMQKRLAASPVVKRCRFLKSKARGCKLKRKNPRVGYVCYP